MAKVIAYLTAERYTTESLDMGISEESGWVDFSYNARVLYQNRVNVKPFFEGDDTDPDFVDDITDIFSAEFGSCESNCDGTYYQIGGFSDYETGDEFSYAVHFERENASGKRDPIDIEEEYGVSI